MNKYTLLLVATIAIFSTAAYGAAPPTDSMEILVGVTQVDITPPVGGNTTGYASAKPTEQIHDPLSARVLVLKQNDVTVALVVWDLCVVNSPWLFEQAAELSVDHLLLANTHTHAGPRLKDDDFPTPETPWRRTVEQRVVAAIKAAQADMFSARFAAAEGAISLGYNRLVRHAEGYAITHFENPEQKPLGPIDPAVGVIRISDEQGQTRAVIIQHACHPVVLGPRNRQISAGFPGVTRRMVEQQLPEGATCFFIQGCCGDINPMTLARGDDRTHDFELVEQVGTKLGQEANRVLADLEEEQGVAASLKIATSELDFANRWEGEDEPVRLGVTTLLINDRIAIMTMPGEPFHGFQQQFREKALVPHAYIFAYCSNGPYDWPSYLPDVESAAYGGYGASDTTRAEVGAGERLVNQGLAQLFRLQGRLKNQPIRHIHQP